MGLALVQSLKVIAHTKIACLTCGDFRTTFEFLDQHKEQLEQTEKIIEKALVNNWQRQVEMNSQVKTNLKNIISSLESQ